MDKPIVRQANNLIEASYKITLGESRIIRLLIAHIHPQDEDFKTYRINVVDFAAIFGISDRDGRLYEMISQASKALMSRVITIKEGQSWLHMNWLSSAEYKQGSGYVELCFDKKLKPYLLQLKGYFTQYKLEKITHFNSNYSIRIYELLKIEEFKADKLGKFKKTFEYEELRVKVGIEEGLYKLFTDFQKAVIETAYKEINENSDIHIYQIDYPKTGRRISHIVFHCEKTKSRTFDYDEILKQEAEKALPLEVREMMSLGIDQRTAEKWRKKYGVKNITRNIAYTKAMQAAGKIRESVSGFLCTAISNNLGGVWEAEQAELRKKKKAKEDKEMSKQQAELEAVEAGRAMFKQVETDFNQRPVNEQQALREAYEKQLTNDTLRGMWKRAKERYPEKPERQPYVKFAFLKFVKDNQ